MGSTASCEDVFTTASPEPAELYVASRGRIMGLSSRGDVRWGLSPGEFNEELCSLALIQPQSLEARQMGLAGANSTLIAFDAASGQIEWRTRLSPTHDAAVVIEVCGPELIGRLSADAQTGNLFYAGCNGSLFGVHVSTGEIAWRVELPGAKAQLVTLTMSGPNELAVASRGKIFLINAHSGEVTWKCKVKPSVKCHATLSIAPAHDFIYFGMHGRVGAVSKSTGAKMWELKISKGTNQQGSNLFSSVVTTLFAFDKLFCISGGVLLSLEPSSGVCTWQLDLDLPAASSASLASHNGHLYVAISGHLVQVDPRSGRVDWACFIPSILQAMPMLCTETSILVGVAGGLAMVEGGVVTQMYPELLDQDTRVATLAGQSCAGSLRQCPAAQVAQLHEDLQGFVKPARCVDESASIMQATPTTETTPVSPTPVDDEGRTFLHAQDLDHIAQEKFIASH